MLLPISVAERNFLDKLRVESLENLDLSEIEETSSFSQIEFEASNFLRRRIVDDAAANRSIERRRSSKNNYTELCPIFRGN